MVSLSIWDLSHVFRGRYYLSDIPPRKNTGICVLAPGLDDVFVRVDLVSNERRGRLRDRGRHGVQLQVVVVPPRGVVLGRGEGARGARTPGGRLRDGQHPRMEDPAVPQRRVPPATQATHR